MQKKFTWSWFLVILFTISITSIIYIGCGSDDEPEETEKPVETTSTDPTEEPIVASSKPIDFDAEKKAIQEVFSEFYKAFNANDIKAVEKTWETSTNAEFAVVWVAGGENEQVPPVISWPKIKSNIEGLWQGIGTAGAKWGPTDRFSEFWIRKRKTNARELEASAKGAMCYKGQNPGLTLVYLVKKKDEWKIQEVDSMTQPAIAKRGGEPLISSYFTDPDAKAD